MGLAELRVSTSCELHEELSDGLVLQQPLRLPALQLATLPTLFLRGQGTGNLFGL